MNEDFLAAMITNTETSKPKQPEPPKNGSQDGEAGVIEYKFMITFRKYPSGKVVPGKIFPIGTQTINQFKQTKKTKKKFKKSEVNEEEVY